MLKGIRGGLALGLAIGLIGAGATATAAAAAKPPQVLDHSRAIPTKSGKFVRIMVFTRQAKRVRIRIDGGAGRKMTKLGAGCTAGSCQKWRIYARRSGSDCYAIRPTATHRNGRSVTRPLDVCEPFGQGQV